MPYVCIIYYAMLQYSVERVYRRREYRICFVALFYTIRSRAWTWKDLDSIQEDITFVLNRLPSNTDGTAFIKTFRIRIILLLEYLLRLSIWDIENGEYLIKTSFIYSIKNYQIHTVSFKFCFEFQRD